MKSGIEEMVNAEMDAILRRNNSRTEKPSEIAAAVEDIRRFTEVVSKVLDRPEPEPQILPLEIGSPPSASPDLTDILQEMRKLSSTAVSILNRPVERNVTPSQVPAPIVNVSPPMVSVNPSITVEPSARRWRFTVTKRDNTAQQRIQEIVIEPLE